MCFSAMASFTTSGLLLICSFITLKKATIKQRMFAAIPLIFSLQQFFEGMIWQQLANNQNALSYGYAYLIMVFILWPLWIPISIRAMVTNKKERSLLRLPITAGLIVALLALAHIGSIEVIISITGNHIYYTAAISHSLTTITTICYLIATISPFFIATITHGRLMGTILAISYIISYLFYASFVISVWCLFAAILSMLTLLIIG